MSEFTSPVSGQGDADPAVPEVDAGGKLSTEGLQQVSGGSVLWRNRRSGKLAIQQAEEEARKAREDYQ